VATNWIQRYQPALTVAVAGSAKRGLAMGPLQSRNQGRRGSPKLSHVGFRSVQPHEPRNLPSQAIGALYCRGSPAPLLGLCTEIRIHQPPPKRVCPGPFWRSVGVTLALALEIRHFLIESPLHFHPARCFPGLQIQTTGLLVEKISLARPQP